MTKAGVNRYTSTRAGDHFGNTTQIEPGQYRSTWQIFSDSFGSGLFLRVTPGQANRPAELAHALGQFAPVTLRPMLACPGGAVQEE